MKRGTRRLKGVRTIKVYKSYNFIDKDPVIDWARTVVQDSKLSLQQVEDEGGPSHATLRNWFYHRTRRPQFATVAATALACGVHIINLRKIRSK